MTIYQKEFAKENGELLKLPQEFSLNVEETSNGVYQIELHDKAGRSVSKQGVDLDNMLETSIEELIRMRK
jgi:hypothetical protein